MAGKVQGLSDDGDQAIAKIILDGKHFDARIDGSTTMAALDRTIDGASTFTVTVSDPERFLQGGRYYERRADLLYDDLWFRMAGVSKQGDLFTLTFEDREVAILRQQTKPRKMSRAKVTRAGFLQALVSEVPHIGFVCPELGKKQPIAPFSKADQTTRKRNRRHGIPADAKLTIKGGRAKRGEIQNLNIALDVAETLGAGHLATMAMLYSGIGESGWRDVMNGNQVAVEAWKKNPNGPWAHTSGYGGVLQGAISVYYNGQHLTYFARMDSPTRTSEQAKSFLQGGRGFQGGGAMKIAKANPGMDPGKIADTVEGAPYSGHYGHQAEAQAIIDAYGGVDSFPGSDVNSGGTYVKSYEFSRGAPAGPRGEDTWACGQRLASEVQWRWFIVAGIVYFISDPDLIASAPRMTLDEATPGVNSIDYDLDTSPRKPNSVTVDCQAAMWAAPPGTVVVLTEDMGPVAGTWIVSDITRNDLTSEQTTINLTAVETVKKEPASQILLRSSLPSKDGGHVTGPDTSRQRPGLAVAGYVFPFAPSLAFAGVDQGVDYSGAGDIWAVGSAIVRRVSPQGSGTGWPGAAGNGTGAMIVYELIDGSRQGWFVYLAENVDPAPGLVVGGEIPAGTVIARARGQYPYLESGWAADSSGTTRTQRFRPEEVARRHIVGTTDGRDFNNFINRIKAASASGVTGKVNASGART